jgi:CDP-diacylglycerol--glycerol-3-phosphate 3-phosphatidyltransferase
MTFASQITLGRLLLVPVFAVLAVYYGQSVAAGEPVEAFRWAAVTVFVVAAASDVLDGFIARRFNQKSHLGAVLDPIADKALVLTALITLTVVEWGSGWSIPIWFSVLVIARDMVILGGVLVLHLMTHHAHIEPHWSGKICTFLLMGTLGWVMLKVIPVSPLYPTCLTAVFVVLSGYYYLRGGIRQLHEHGHAEPRP